MQRFLLTTGALITFLGVAGPSFAQAPSAPPSPELAPPPQEPTPPLPAPPPPAPAPQPAPLPPYEYRPVAPKPPVHAPRFALWTGALVSAATFGNGFFRNERGLSETTGSFVHPGIAAQVDVGVRLERRYIPYVTYEHLFSFGTGRRFDGQGGTAYGQFYGFGFRYLFGNPDFIAGFADLSFGRRVVHVSSNDQGYSMSTFEFLRLGLGAEIRFTSHFSLTPQVNLSSGVMSSTSGDVTYSPQAQRDGLSHPRYVNGASIEESTSYLVFGVGVGAHFDLFGK